MGKDRGQAMTAQQCAKYVGLSVPTLARYRIDGKGPPYNKFGNKTVYYEKDVEAWLEKHSFTSVAQSKQPTARRRQRKSPRHPDDVR